MDEETIRKIAREEARHMRDNEIKQTVKETLREIGLQPDDPEAAQDQAAMIRNLHSMVKTGRKAAVWTIAALFIGAVVESVRRSIGGS